MPKWRRPWGSSKSRQPSSLLSTGSSAAGGGGGGGGGGEFSRSSTGVSDGLRVGVNLGGNELDLRDGRWVLTSDSNAVHRRETDELRAEIADLREELARARRGGGSPRRGGSAPVSPRGRSGARDRDDADAREAAAQRRANQRLLAENHELRFRNKVLLAMCTISECDYRALFHEAGLEAP